MRKNQGRQPKKWMDSVNEDVHRVPKKNWYTKLILIT